MGLQGPPGVPPPNVAVTNANNNFAAPQTVGGSVSITGAGNGLVFPDGTVQTTAATSGGTSGGTISCSTFEISSTSPITPAGYTPLSQITGGNVWFTMAPMPTPRAYFATAADAQGNIYAIGGHGANGILGTVEKYTPAVTIYTFIKN